MPAWVADRPEVDPRHQFYIDAFFALITCRQGGAIPWTAIQSFAIDRGLDLLERRFFEDVIWHLQGAYDKWQKAQLPSGGPGGGAAAQLSGGRR